MIKLYVVVVVVMLVVYVRWYDVLVSWHMPAQAAPLFPATFILMHTFQNMDTMGIFVAFIP